MRSSISIYKDQLEAQQRSVRRELALASRQATLQRTANARLKTQQQAALAAASVRAETNTLLQRNVRDGMTDIQPASEAAQLELAGRCAQQMEHIFPDPQARNWFNLFKMVDTNQTGRICFYELDQMVRAPRERLPPRAHFSPPSSFLLSRARALTIVVGLGLRCVLFSRSPSASSAITSSSRSGARSMAT